MSSPLKFSWLFSLNRNQSYLIANVQLQHQWLVSAPLLYPEIVQQREHVAYVDVAHAHRTQEGGAGHCMRLCQSAYACSQKLSSNLNGE